MTLALSLAALILLANFFAWVLCAAASRSDAVWPEIVDEEGRR